MYVGAMKDKQSVCRLKLKEVCHQYGTINILQDISFEVNTGEVIVLVGPSGCGKSTILNLLSGHIVPTSGTIDLEGAIRTVYQQDGLFPWLTVSENISMGLRFVRGEQKKEQELLALVELIHLKGFEQHYPHQLSGGMRQRVELARVLAGDTDILLMDEPFSALDYQTRLRMRQELARILLHRNRTVVFVTHDIEEAAQLADRVLVLTNRPASICYELKIDAPRPRQLTDDSVVAAMKTILKELGLQDSDPSK
jgi:NitT/TauT family transport system ATP-binding protein